MNKKAFFPLIAAGLAPALVLALILAVLSVPVLAEVAPGQGGKEATVDREVRLDELFAELQSIDGAFDAKVVEKTILSIWSQSGSATIDLLMDRAASVSLEGDNKLALSLLNRVVELQPDYAEGFHRRSHLYLHDENYTDAMVDLQKTLSLEPRHFIAIRSLGDILRQAGDLNAALDAYRMAIKINPHMDDVRNAINELAYQVEGRGI